MWVSPFRHLRIKRYLLLPAAFRSLSRLSSALSAKASTLRSFMLDLFQSSLPFRHSVDYSGASSFINELVVLFLSELACVLHFSDVLIYLSITSCLLTGHDLSYQLLCMKFSRYISEHALRPPRLFLSAIRIPGFRIL